MDRALGDELPGSPPGGSRSSTVDLLNRYRAGDQSALNELLARNLQPLRRWATGRLPHCARDLRDTEDLVQDAVLLTIPHLDRFEHRGEGALLAYLRETLMNLLRNEYRRTGRRPDHRAVDSTIMEHGPSPLDDAVGTDLREDYEQALAKLSDSDREAVILRVELQLAYQEIAQAMQKSSADAARMTVSRALLRLAGHMRH